MASFYISVDIETAGPTPAEHSLLALGACTVAEPIRTFYVELIPDRSAVDEKALAVSGLSLDRLSVEGTVAGDAVNEFARWVDNVTPQGDRPVFVALNAPFDWMFVADYLHRYAGRNPFGHSAIDLKALYMGVSGAPWRETSLSHMAARYDMDVTLPHHALEDATIQAEVFRRLLAEHGGDVVE